MKSLTLEELISTIKEDKKLQGFSVFIPLIQFLISVKDKPDFISLQVLGVELGPSNIIIQFFGNPLTNCKLIDYLGEAIILSREKSPRKFKILQDKSLKPNLLVLE